jgi:hypothetical protein
LVVKDLSSSKKADAGCHALNHTARTIAAAWSAHQDGNRDEHRRAKRDEGMRPYTSRLTRTKAIPAYRSARKRCDEEPEKYRGLACVKREVKTEVH